MADHFAVGVPEPFLDNGLRHSGVRASRAKVMAKRMQAAIQKPVSNFTRDLFFQRLQHVANKRISNRIRFQTATMDTVKNQAILGMFLVDQDLAKLLVDWKRTAAAALGFTSRFLAAAALGAFVAEMDRLRHPSSVAMPAQKYVALCKPEP